MKYLSGKNQTTDDIMQNLTIQTDSVNVNLGTVNNVYQEIPGLELQSNPTKSPHFNDSTIQMLNILCWATLVLLFVGFLGFIILAISI
jgi:hypothetical protein